MLSNSLGDILSIQIETTSRCNLECITCLKPAYKEVWQERDMGDRLFGQILKQLPTESAVHLQGWGEPLLHPDTIKHIGQLKAKGATLSFTTNGTIMNKDVAKALIESDMDGLTFSMAGDCGHTQDRLRGPGSFDQLQNSIRTFIAAKKGYGRSSPKVAVSYLLTPETVRELPNAVSWCRKVGVDAFIAGHLTQAACQNQQELQLILSKKEARHYRRLRIQAQMRTLLGNMRLELAQFHPVLTPVCDKNPLNSLFISASGDVSPCVFLCPPVSGTVSWRYKGVESRQERLVFGNLHDSTLAEIWEQAEYRRFREAFKVRKEFHDNKLNGISYSLAGSVQLDAAVTAIKDYFARNLPPKPCRYCAKIEGY